MHTHHVRSYEACTRTTSTWDKFEVGFALMCRYTHVRMLRNCRYIAVFTCSSTVYHSYTYISTFYQESSITNAWKTTSSSSITTGARVSLSYSLPTRFLFNTPRDWAASTEDKPTDCNALWAAPPFLTFKKKRCKDDPYRLPGLPDRKAWKISIQISRVKNQRNMGMESLPKFFARQSRGISRAFFCAATWQKRPRHL